jgi:hypothetical protein
MGKLKQLIIKWIKDNITVVYTPNKYYKDFTLKIYIYNILILDIWRENRDKDTTYRHGVIAIKNGWLDNE